MSLIFQSLQKLKSNLTPPSSGHANPAPQQGQATAKPYLWLRPILIGLVLVLALGCGAVYAVQYLKDRAGDNEIHTTNQLQRHDIRPNNRMTPSEAAAGAEDAADVKQAQPQPVTTTASKGRAQFYPPAEKRPDIPLTPVAQVSAQSRPLPAAPELVDSTPTVSPKVFDPLSKVENGLAPSAQEHSISDAALEAVERARRKALEKTARIGSLVHRIEQALAGAADVGDVGTLLGQLARIKGENHPYVMKLRAYWEFQRGGYQAAETDLKKVIAIHPDDLEAGINLALIEIRAQRYADAMTRLKHLRHAYPDNAEVADLIKRLK